MAVSMIQQIHQREAEQASTAVLHLSRRPMIGHIGCADHHRAFAWAGYQAMKRGKIVLSLCADLPALHQEALRLVDEIQVLNLAGHIDPRTLHELCAAHNLRKPISWMEPWSMYCPRCQCVGLEAQHFFHNALSLGELNDLFEALSVSQLVYLEGQFADWYGQIVPVVLLADGYPSLQVDLCCLRCDHYARTAFAIAGECGSWTMLLEQDGTFLMDLCDADERARLLLCADCETLLCGQAGNGMSERGVLYV